MPDDQREVVDQITLTEFLKSKSQLENIGGAAYLAEMVQVVPSASHIRFHCKIVRDKALLRGLIRTATDASALPVVSGTVSTSTFP